MPTDYVEPHVSDPDYHAALRSLQQGEWEAGLVGIARLMERYPLDQDLRALNQETQLRARVDENEQDDRRMEKRRRFRKITRYAVILLLVAGLAGVGVRYYSTWLQGQVAAASQATRARLQEASLIAKMLDARTLLRAGRPGEAQALLSEIAQVNPQFPGLQDALAQAEAATSVEAQYAEAIGLIDQQDWDKALSLFQAIADKDPQYKDVTLQIASIEKQKLLSESLAEAEAKYLAGDWTAAASAYEGVRSFDAEYQRESVEERLFNCYVNSAREALVGQSDSLEALRTAEGYFRKALALRPQDPEVKTERELAGLYLKAQDDFAVSRWDDVITTLEIVHSQSADYAQGTARQTLYEAYVARGDAGMLGGDYLTALSDYQRALVLAEQDQDAVLRLYEANLKAGDAQAAQSNFEAGVNYYRAAVELGGLRERAQENPVLAASLQEADGYVEKGNFGTALERYRRAVRAADSTQATVTHVVQAGEYLTLLASRYRSTVRAIALANNIANPNRILEGQELVIPVLP